MEQRTEFEQVVDMHYASLYRFALSLAREQADACDLVQETFYRWAEKGHQLKDRSKAKSWLFTTLHREFLHRNSRVTRFPQVELADAEPELPQVENRGKGAADASMLIEALAKLDPGFRAAVALFYLEDYTYPEIAEVLNVPLGTVKSRISRGLGQLQKLLAEPAMAEGRVV